MAQVEASMALEEVQCLAEAEVGAENNTLEAVEAALQRAGCWMSLPGLLEAPKKG
jgi:hypothetical protein